MIFIDIAILAGIVIAWMRRKARTRLRKSHPELIDTFDQAAKAIGIGLLAYATLIVWMIAAS